MNFLNEKSAEVIHQIYYLNPMTHVIKSYRDVLLDLSSPDLMSLAMAFGLGLLLLIWGYCVFMKSESRFAEEV